MKGPQYFFSGALIFPIFFEIVAYLPNDELVSLGPWISVAAFLLFGISGFILL